MNPLELIKYCDENDIEYHIERNDTDNNQYNLICNREDRDKIDNWINLKELESKIKNIKSYGIDE